MLKPKTSARGFTLIELLVVIAIIGILSSIVLASLSKARSKGLDSKVKSQLSNIRTTAESYFNNQGTYSVASTCHDGMFADTETSMATYTDTANYPVNTVLKCNANGSSYAVSANLNAAGSYWCVDSNGVSKAENLDPGSVTTCP